MYAYILLSVSSGLENVSDEIRSYRGQGLRTPFMLVDARLVYRLSLNAKYFKSIPHLLCTLMTLNTALNVQVTFCRKFKILSMDNLRNTGSKFRCQ